jgi:hypothetical protein
MNRCQLTRIVRRGLELPLPLLVDLDDVALFLGLPAGEPLALRMLDDGVEVLVVGGVDDVKEVVPVREISLGLLLREELGQLGLSHGVLDKVHHAELVVAGHLDGAQLGPGDQMLTASEDILQEVLRDLFDWGQVVLS